MDIFVTMLWTFFGTSFGGQFEKYPLVEIATSVKTDAHTDIIEMKLHNFGDVFWDNFGINFGDNWGTIICKITCQLKLPQV